VNTSSKSSGQVRTSRSSGQGQGHRSKTAYTLCLRSSVQYVPGLQAGKGRERKAHLCALFTGGLTFIACLQYIKGRAIVHNINLIIKVRYTRLTYMGDTTNETFICQSVLRLSDQCSYCHCPSFSQVIKPLFRCPLTLATGLIPPFPRTLKPLNVFILLNG